jgi:hypothetical protein
MDLILKESRVVLLSISDLRKAEGWLGRNPGGRARDAQNFPSHNSAFGYTSVKLKAGELVARCFSIL